MNPESLASAKSFVAGGSRIAVVGARFCGLVAETSTWRAIHLSSSARLLSMLERRMSQCLYCFSTFTETTCQLFERLLYTFLNRPSTSSPKTWKLWSKIAGRILARKISYLQKKKKQCKYYDFLFKCTSLIVVNKRNYFWVFLSKIYYSW